MPPALVDEFDDDSVTNGMPDYEEKDEEPQSDVQSDLPPSYEAEENGKQEEYEEEDEDEDENGDEGDDGDEGEDEFVVESILTHAIDKDGELRFHVKWEGYEDPNDMTWEPLENLEAATVVLNEYFKKIGGRKAVMMEVEAKKAEIAKKKAAKAGNKRKRGRPSMGGSTPGTSKKARNHPGDTTPPREPEKFVPPSGSWEDHIANIDIIRNDDDGSLVVYLTWNNGQKTRHETSQVYKRCPQQMLRFYERHVKIISNANANGDDQAGKGWE